MSWSLFLMMAPCNPLITFSLGNPGRRNPANQLRLVVYPHYLQGFLYIPHGCFGFLNHQRKRQATADPHVKLNVSSQDCGRISMIFLGRQNRRRNSLIFLKIPHPKSSKPSILNLAGSFSSSTITSLVDDNNVTKKVSWPLKTYLKSEDQKTLLFAASKPLHWRVQLTWKSLVLAILGEFSQFNRCKPSHQHLQVPKMEGFLKSKSLCSGGGITPLHKPYPYSLYRCFVPPCSRYLKYLIQKKTFPETNSQPASSWKSMKLEDENFFFGGGEVSGLFF